MTPATPAVLHPSRAAAAHALGADAPGPSPSGAGAQFAAQLLQAQKTPPPQAQPVPQPAAPAQRQPGSTASRDERLAADRAAERQAARREPPIDKQPAAATQESAPPATMPPSRQQADAARRGASAERERELDAAPVQDDEATADPAAAASEADAAGRPTHAAETDDAATPVDWLSALGLAPLPAASALPLSAAAASGAAAAQALPAASGIAAPLGAVPGARDATDIALAAQEMQDPRAAAQFAGGAAGGDATAALAAAPSQTATMPAAAGADALRSIEAPSSPGPHLPGLPSAMPGGSAAAPATAQIATPLHAPDFGQALAAQLTTFAREGVQEASLQLNPAEMGPIDVKIVVDGQKAQIDFSAAHAATRQALQDGLPGLAAALHAGGLTLAGGGVFEQRHQPGRDAAPASHGRAGAKGEGGLGGVEAAGRPAALPAARGLLDLYA